jgi:la-related protein 1
MMKASIILRCDGVTIILRHFCRYGLECLFRFYSYGLQARFRPEIYRDFMRQTIADINKAELYGIEKFWAFLKYYKYAPQLEVDPFLKIELAKYKKFDDFAVDPAIAAKKERENEAANSQAQTTNEPSSKKP